MPEKAGDETPTALLGDRSMRQKEITEFSPAGEQCPTCGREYKNTHGMRIHHAQVHGERLGVVEKVCEICGDDYETITIRANQSKYCSNECKHIGRRSREERSCDVCGTSFTCNTKSSQKLCSPECRYEMMRQAPPEESPAWNGGMVGLTCGECGSEFEVKRHQASFRKHCSNACAGRARSRLPPEENPMYRDGQSLQLYTTLRQALNDEAWRITRKRITDGAACELCGELADGRAHHTHHIIPILAGGTNADELLMPLCGGCHKRVEQYTQRFAEYLFVE